MRNIVFVTILFALIILSNGCSGCSPSGRRADAARASLNMINRQESSSVGMKRNRNHEVVAEAESNTVESKKVLPLSVLYNKYKKSVFLVYTSNGRNGFQGSGFFISKDGLAISNYHVFEDTSRGLEVIKTVDGKRFRIKEVIESNKKEDYIIFRVNIGNYNILNPIHVASQVPQTGENVFTIGNPRGLESTLSKGIVSSLREKDDLIQTTTEITHGSSGGPLLNMKGEVIGITALGEGEADLNFAIDIRVLRLSRFYL